MNFVVDASVAAKWFVEEDHRAEALRLLDHAPRLLAPDWILQEIAHLAFKKWRDREIGEEHAKAMVRSLPSFVPRLYPSAELTGHALEIAFALRHPVYDCLYIACAGVTGGVLVTADKELCEAVRGTAFEDIVRYLGDPARYPHGPSSVGAGLKPAPTKDGDRGRR